MFGGPQDYRQRAPYVSYLVKVHQDLLLTLEQVKASRDQVNNTRFLCQAYHRTMQVHTFIEKREPLMVKYAQTRLPSLLVDSFHRFVWKRFVEQFVATEMPDEQAMLASQFLAQSDKAMRADKLWEMASAGDLEIVSALLEKYFMCRIYVRYATSITIYFA